MKKFQVALSVVLIAVLILLLITFTTNKQTEDSNINSGNLINGTENVINVVNNSTDQGNFASGISLEELSKHNTKEDCWVVYKDKVYDVSDFIPKHKGGESAIGNTCGSTNFESAFQNQHGTSKASLFMKVTTYIGEFSA